MRVDKNWKKDTSQGKMKSETDRSCILAKSSMCVNGKTGF